MNGQVRIRAYTRAVNTFIRELLRARIYSEDWTLGRDHVEFTVKISDYERVTELLTDFNVDFRKVRAFGLLNLMDKAKRRAMLIAGMLIGLAALSVCSLFAFRTEIVGARECKDSIERFIAKEGFNGVFLKSGVDIDRLELKLIEALPEIAEATAFFDGAVLKIAVICHENPVSDSEQTKAKYSAYKAVVTRIYVTSGTPRVAAGDTVESGDVLIDAYINTNKDEYQQPGDEKLVPVPAKGEVYGKVYYHKRLILTDEAVIRERSGRTDITRDLYIGSIRLGRQSKTKFHDYDCVIVYNSFGALKIATNTYYETIERVVGREEYRARLIAGASAELIAEMPEGAQILNNSVSENGDIIDVYYEAEHRIDA